MGFLDSSSSIVTAILTRKGRELLARNDGSFRITKFAFGDDEINYQLYNSATENDNDILNLPILEPSSNELTALRYRLVTAPKGTTRIAYIVATPTLLILQNSNTVGARLSKIGTITVSTQIGTDSTYLIVSRNPAIAFSRTPIVTALIESSTNESVAVIAIESSIRDGSTYIDIIGRDTGAIISIPIIVTSSALSEQ